MVATRVGGVPEIVVDGETGLLVSPEDAPGLAEGMRRVMEDQTERQRMSEKARQRAIDFSWERIAGHYLNAYQAAKESLAAPVS